jgi:hypothetical protein
MNIILRSRDKFDVLAELNTNTGQISWFSRCTNLAKSSGPVCGAIAQLQGRVLCLYRETGTLHFKIDDEDFELSETTEVELVHVKEYTNRITILRQDTVLFTWVYQRPLIDPPLEQDPTAFVEEEHFDFCLFVYNVANDPERRERIWALC